MRAAAIRLALAGLCGIGSAGGVAAMAHASGPDREPVAQNRADSDAAFRVDARLVYRALHPVCPPTGKPELLVQYAPLLRQLSRVERRAAGAPYAAILNAERKANSDLAAVVDCARPDGPGVTRESIAATLDPVAPALNRMHRIISIYTPRRR
ncbi:hypothetical protein [Sphingomonas sp. G-3-2-10]|uniref:hypothetical protein n=1 Tax=Sphingomonas sp. G-3-2-10 TaxID=2728838 RepID=UPI00146B360F|nr:hypothetical protein [Sphingomonas sp. G-3-2-10]NML07896.1 hypothetical protein [Sphingomonas sp. G-3-2-10]